MKIVIDEKICIKNGMTLSEVIAALLASSVDDVQQLLEDMVTKEMLIKPDSSNNLELTRHWAQVVEGIMLDSEKDVEPEDRIAKLVTRLQQTFPGGKKEGTSQYWRGNKKEITNKLKTFFKTYGTYSDTQILTAAQNYVESFNGRYRHMRLLKYFLIKNERKIDENGIGTIVEVSDLASYIENANSTQDLKEDWTTTIN